MSYCTLYNVQCIIYNAQCKLYTKLFNVYCSLNTVHCLLYTVNCSLYHILCTVCAACCCLLQEWHCSLLDYYHRINQIRHNQIREGNLDMERVLFFSLHVWSRTWLLLFREAIRRKNQFLFGFFPNGLDLPPVFLEPFEELL